MVLVKIQYQSTKFNQESYKKGITDEFIEPIVIMNRDKPMAQIKDEDLVIFFNFRTDRGRQLTEVLTNMI